MSNDPDKKRSNLKRLLAPRHIAFIGGSDADYSAGQCARRFKGPVWGVNPKRSEMGGQPCFARVRDLPEAPDAVFLATPRSATLEVISELREAGAGGIACFTAGYGETGQAGKQAERELVAAAGDMALVGPNCYGLINYVHGATLWPFGAGSSQCERGVALIMQSGMITADLAMNQRSVPLTYVISAGNQASLAIEDYIDVLVDDPHVTAFGIYIEGIRDVEKFARACLRALQANKPVVVLKAGSSSIGTRLAVSHTGSISGADEVHQALFDRVGVTRVYSPELMLETLKFMTVSGIPAGRRIAAFTCSGGEALMVADYCERSGLELPQPSNGARAELECLLPDIATVSNPLDYTTPLWGNREVMPKVFDAALKDGFDAAIIIQDYPPQEFEADNTLYRADGQSYMEAVSRAGIPAGICSELSENFDRESREIYIAGGVTPMQGFDRGLDALLLACEYQENRSRLLATGNAHPGDFQLLMPSLAMGKLRLLDEWQSKKQLAESEIRIPEGELLPLKEWHRSPDVAAGIGFPVVLKLVAEGLAHKTEQGVVFLSLNSKDEVSVATQKIQSVVHREGIAKSTRGLLVEAMVSDAIYELLVGIQYDEQFGLTMVVASGGILVELYRDSVTLLLPTDTSTVRHALSRLKCFPVLKGYRGKPGADIDAVVNDILKIAGFAEDKAAQLVEMDINPLMVQSDGVVAVDALIRVRK
jgi:acyl-CoA synthetase (NDP forming)